MRPLIGISKLARIYAIEGHFRVSGIADHEDSQASPHQRAFALQFGVPCETSESATATKPITDPQTDPAYSAGMAS